MAPKLPTPPPVPTMSNEELAELSAGQVAFFLGYAAVLLLWALAEYFVRTRAAKETLPDYDEADKERPEKPLVKTPSNGPLEAPPPQRSLVAAVFDPTSPLVEVLMLKQQALVEARECLRDMAEFGAHLTFFYLCDRTQFFPEPFGKTRSVDVFWFIYFILVAYNVAHHLKKGGTGAYLNRDQTEEWKGWMQILFLMYHYFDAKEQYNAIRIYIAAYVWMTGFGNFSFYYIRKDFSPSRFFQMLWRLNFLVFWVCIVMNNNYMLYYICPMHTIWTIFVYLVLLIGNEHNTNNTVVMGKVVGSFVLVWLLWSNQEYFYAFWQYFGPLVRKVDPKNPNPPHELHEWWFRSGLDRYIWIFGMVCANFHPVTEKFLHWMDAQPPSARYTLRVLVTVMLLGIGVWWYTEVFTLEKRAYNQSHPYTSCIPIGIYIILRNLTPTLREYHMAYFAFLGKITLETYIGQFHIWLATGYPNADPKKLLSVLPKEYALLNFFIVTPVYLFISYRLFHLTNTLKFAFLPSKDNPRLYRNVILFFSTWAAVFGAGYGIKLAMSAQ